MLSKTTESSEAYTEIQRLVHCIEMLVVATVENPALHSPEARQGWARREQVETKTAERANGSESIYKASRAQREGANLRLLQRLSSSAVR